MAKTAKKSTKPAPKKSSAKPVAKKSASKPAVKKAVAKAVSKKAAAKKVAPKPVAKKVVAKPAAKKSVAKAAPKKAAAKPVVKKLASKPATKKVVSKPIAKKAAPKKAVAKAVAKKVASKPAAKKVVQKPTPKKPIAKKAALNPKNGKLTDIKPKDISKKAIDKLGKKAVVKPTQKKVESKTVAKKVVAKVAPKKVIAKPIAKKSKTAKVPPSIRGVVVDKKSAPVKANSKPVNVKPIAILKEDKSAKMALRRKKIQEIKNNYESNLNHEDDNYEDYRLPIIGRTRFNDADLNEFRAIINKKLAEAREELNFYQDQMKESEMNDDDIKFSGMEDGGHTNDKEHLSAMANRQVKFIQNLEGAIVRIENKTYGICRMTGNLIDKKRLMAVPHATLSMEAKLGGKKK